MSKFQLSHNFRFALSEKIEDAYYRFGMVNVIVYGPQGIGKSSYSIQVLRDLYPNSEEWKKYLVFKPEDFINLVSDLMNKEQRAKCIVWDDAGLWLYALDWYESLVKAAVKFFNVARTITAGVILTTPDPTMISSNIRRLPGLYRARIIKQNSQVARIARIYKQTQLPSGKMGWPSLKMEDHFSQTLPDDVYEWYLPIRRSYAIEAMNLMKQSIQRRAAFANEHTYTPLNKVKMVNPE